MSACRFCKKWFAHSLRDLFVKSSCSICNNLRKWKGRAPVNYEDPLSSDDDDEIMWALSINDKFYDLMLIVNTTLNQMEAELPYVYDSTSFSSSIDVHVATHVRFISVCK